jgi:hypothetical protein
MASVPGMTNEGTPFPREPFVFPSYRNIGPPHIATLSLPGLTIGLPVWLFSTQVVSNAVSASFVSTSPQENQPHVDPSPSSPMIFLLPYSLARSSSISYSSLSESSKASNSVDKKKKKKHKNKKKKNKQGSQLPTTARHVGKDPVTVNHAGSFDDAKITQTTCKPKYPCNICKGNHLIKDFPGLSKVIEAWCTQLRQPMSSTSQQHVDDLPSTSQDTIGKKKSRVKFPCMLCKGSHLTHLFPCMDEASKLLEDMVSQPQLPASYRKLTLDPPIVDGMINPVPSSVNPVDHVVNLVMSSFELVDKVVDLISSLVDPTLLLESETKEIDPFPPVDPILPLENETQTVDLISSSVDPTLPLESKPDTAHVFLVDTESTMLGVIPPSPMKSPPSNEAILFDWGALTRPRLPSHIPFHIIVQVCGWDIPQTLIDEGAFTSILSSITWQDLGCLYLVPITQNLLAFNIRTSQPLGTLP